MLTGRGAVMIGDLAMLPATQYAIDVLKVSNILIVGHRDCGGIKAAMSRQSFGTTIDAWVRHGASLLCQWWVLLMRAPSPRRVPTAHNVWRDSQCGLP